MKLAQIGYLQSHGRPLPTYKGPPWPQPEEEKAESACDLIVWYAAHPEATCSFRTALVLARLHRDFAPRATLDVERSVLLCC